MAKGIDMAGKIYRDVSVFRCILSTLSDITCSFLANNNGSINDIDGVILLSYWIEQHG